jgi:hypothetical protein
MWSTKRSIVDSDRSSHSATADKEARKAKKEIREKWSVRVLRRGSLTGPAFIEFTFPTKGGAASRFRSAYDKMRHLKNLLDEFSNYLPIFPTDIDETDAARGAFIQDLVARASGTFELLPERTGFVDADTFVTWSDILHADGRRIPVPGDDNSVKHKFADSKGTLQGTTDLVLKLANESTYLAFGIGVALATPLPSYVNLRRTAGDHVATLLRETADFNFSGPSSSGKSSANLAAMSLAGSPERAESFDFSRRGLAEMASDSNDMPSVVDDTEKAADGPAALVGALKTMVHVLPGGRSKVISRGVEQFPPLRWSTFGLSSSPRPIRVLAQQCRWKMTAGDMVRLFNISVPGPKKGGIFDRIDGAPAERAKRSIKLISKLERGYTNHCGQVFPRWILYLMAQDRSGEIIKRVNKFIEHVGAGSNGWEVRFAQKFGVIYAAMMMGIDAGLLPWPRSLPREVVTKCYRKARNAAKTNQERVAEAAGRLHQLIHKPGRLVDASNDLRAGRPIKVMGKCLAIQFAKDGRVKYGVLDSALVKILRCKKAKALFVQRFAKSGLLADGHGHAGTAQQRLKIERKGKIIDRPRLWVIDARKFASCPSRAKSMTHRVHWAPSDAGVVSTHRRPNGDARTTSKEVRGARFSEPGYPLALRTCRVFFGCLAGDAPLAPPMAKSSSFLPPFKAAVSQRGRRPRPAQVSVGLAGLRYLGATRPNRPPGRPRRPPPPYPSSLDSSDSSS